MSIQGDIRREERRNRALLRALNEEALEEAGTRIRRAQAELNRQQDRVAVSIASATEAGLPVAEISELTGLSRQKIYELRDRIRGGGDQFLRRLLAQLIAAGSQATPVSLAEELGAPVGKVEEGLEALRDKRLLEPVRITGADGVKTTVFRPTATAIKEIEGWVLRSDHPEGRWRLFVGLEPEEVQSLMRVLDQAAQELELVILEPEANDDDVLGPELGLVVRASDEREAVDEGSRQVRRLRQQANLPEQPVLVSALAPANAAREQILREPFADFLRQRGYQVARREPRLQGYDLVASRDDSVMIASVKGGERVGVGAVRAISGLSSFDQPGQDVDRSLVVSSGTALSKEARSLAQATGVRLYTVDPSGDVHRLDG
jgi:hypothetical protein